MKKWKLVGNSWCKWPSRPSGLIEMIGGSYLSASPHISYRKLLEPLVNRNFAIHTWSYLPGLDHQAQANKAWKDLRICRKYLEARVGDLLIPLRLGHSLGCKLHLLAPDGGRNSKALITLSFNNFTANQSIPMISKIAPSLGFQNEFSPDPKETLKLILEKYQQPNNLLVTFNQDRLDQSKSLLEQLKKRQTDYSISVELEGDHLTPASAGLRRKFLGEWADDNKKDNSINELIDMVCKWASQ